MNDKESRKRCVVERSGSYLKVEDDKDILFVVVTVCLAASAFSHQVVKCDVSHR
jgi:hypothetical protein